MNNRIEKVDFLSFVKLLKKRTGLAVDIWADDSGCLREEFFGCAVVLFPKGKGYPADPKNLVPMSVSEGAEIWTDSINEIDLSPEELLQIKLFVRENRVKLARPSVGKTAFALSIAANMAYGDNPVPIGFFSLEMSGASLMERILASRSHVNLMKFRNGILDSETKNRLMDTASSLYDYTKNLIVQDTPNIKLLEIRSQARLLVRQYHVKAIFIDYIGLVDLNPANANMPRHEQVSQISRSLKQLARELEIPIICLCQVNRDAGKERPPMLADLRDSGSIEQDADLVLLMDDESKRLDEKGKIAQYEEEDFDSETESRLSVRPVKIIIAKQRNGSTGVFKLNFVSDYVSFIEIESF